MVTLPVWGNAAVPAEADTSRPWRTSEATAAKKRRPHVPGGHVEPTRARGRPGYPVRGSNRARMQPSARLRPYWLVQHWFRAVRNTHAYREEPRVICEQPPVLHEALDGVLLVSDAQAHRLGVLLLFRELREGRRAAGVQVEGVVHAQRAHALLCILLCRDGLDLKRHGPPL